MTLHVERPTPGACARCGHDPACGFASIITNLGERWYCHDDTHSCYVEAMSDNALRGERFRLATTDDRLHRVFTDYLINAGGMVYVTKTGKVLTEYDILALADEAERGYDVSQLKARRRD